MATIGKLRPRGIGWFAHLMAYHCVAYFTCSASGGRVCRDLSRTPCYPFPKMGFWVRKLAVGHRETASRSLGYQGYQEVWVPKILAFPLTTREILSKHLTSLGLCSFIRTRRSLRFLASSLWVSKCLGLCPRQGWMKSWDPGGSTFLGQHGTEHLIYDTLAMGTGWL